MQKDDCQENEDKPQTRKIYLQKVIRYNNPTLPTDTIFLTKEGKEARIYNGTRIVSSISDARKTGQLCVKE